MMAHHWGIKTFYYSLINKQGAKATQEDKQPDNVISLNFNQQAELDDDCEACKL
jgi:hypothetical protein